MKVIRLTLLSSLLFVFLLGCSLNRSPLFDYDKEGKPVQIRRVAKYPTVDYFHRFTAGAYKENLSRLHFMLSPEQEEIIKKYGQPDYLRKTFFSTRKEYVKEWVYLSANMVFQFIKGRLVYEGPVTDKEKVMIIWGYPKSIYIRAQTPDLTNESFEYYYIFSDDFLNFHFSNGNLIPGQGPIW